MPTGKISEAKKAERERLAKERLDKYVKETVAKAPPFTEAQAAIISALLGSAAPIPEPPEPKPAKKDEWDV